MGSIVVVCTGNVCRSPIGEAVLGSLLPDVAVSSAGTHAMVGRPAAPETTQFVSRELGVELDHVSRQLINAHAEAADLIITMTTEQRAWMAREAPRALRRTFTLRELDEILALTPNSPCSESVRGIALDASRLRSRVGTAGGELDIADPYGGPPDGYERAFREVLTSSRRIAHSITQYASLT